MGLTSSTYIYILYFKLIYNLIFIQTNMNFRIFVLLLALLLLTANAKNEPEDDDN